MNQQEASYRRNDISILNPPNNSNAGWSADHNHAPWDSKIAIFFPFFLFAKLNICSREDGWGWGLVDRQKQLQIISDQECQTHLIFTVAAAAALPGSAVRLCVLANSASGVSQSHFVFPSFSLSLSLAPFLHELLPLWGRAGKLNRGRGREVIYFWAIPGERYE